MALVVILGSVMSVLDTTVVNVALDTLSRDLHALLSTIQWVVTGYLLALGIVMPLTGWRWPGSEPSSAGWPPRRRRRSGNE